MKSSNKVEGLKVDLQIVFSILKGMLQEEFNELGK